VQHRDVGGVEGAADLLQEPGEGCLLPEGRAGHGRQGLGLGRRPGGLHGPSGGDVDDGADRDGHGQVHAKHEQVLGALDGELVDRWGEEVVQQQATTDRGGPRRAQPTDERDGDDKQQGQQDRRRVAQLLAVRDEDRRQQR